MTFKGVLATAVVLLAICLMVRGQSAPVHRPTVHVTLHAKKGKR
jgi:hypothetical protein